MGGSGRNVMGDNRIEWEVVGCNRTKRAELNTSCQSFKKSRIDD
jgi:hypothetical protein